MAKLKDHREFQAMTPEGADGIFLRLARLKARMDAVSARHKEALAKLEADHKDKLAPLMAEYGALSLQLCNYITANPDRFTKPRKRPVGQIGSYGITTDPAYVKLLDEEAVIRFALEQGYDDLLITKHAPDKVGILRRITGGETVPGAVAVPAGDVAKFTFRKGYAEQLEDA